MIVTQFDNNYLRWADLFVRSLTATNPQEAMHLDAVNLSLAQAAGLTNRNRGVTIQNHGLAQTDREFMTNRRVDVFMEVFNREPADWFLFMDADMLFRGSLGPLLAKVQDADAALVLRSGWYEGNYSELMRVACGVVLVKPSARPLMERWQQLIHGTEPLHGVQPWKWWWDQIALWTAVRQVQGVKIAAIEEEVYCDRFMTPAATIWSANLPHQKERQFREFTRETERLEAAK